MLGKLYVQFSVTKLMFKRFLDKSKNEERTTKLRMYIFAFNFLVTKIS